MATYLKFQVSTRSCWIQNIITCPFLNLLTQLTWKYQVFEFNFVTPSPFNCLNMGLCSNSLLHCHCFGVGDCFWKLKLGINTTAQNNSSVGVMWPLQLLATVHPNIMRHGRLFIWLQFFLFLTFSFLFIFFSFDLYFSFYLHFSFSFSFYLDFSFSFYLYFSFHLHFSFSFILNTLSKVTFDPHVFNCYVFNWIYK